MPMSWMPVMTTLHNPSARLDQSKTFEPKLLRMYASICARHCRQCNNTDNGSAALQTIHEQRQRRITNYTSALPNNGSAALQTIDRHCRDFLHVSAMPRCKNCRQSRQQSHTLALPDHSWVIITDRKHDTLCIVHKIIFDMTTDKLRY